MQYTAKTAPRRIRTRTQTGGDGLAPGHAPREGAEDHRRLRDAARRRRPARYAGAADSRWAPLGACVFAAVSLNSPTPVPREDGGERLGPDALLPRGPVCVAPAGPGWPPGSAGCDADSAGRVGGLTAPRRVAEI